MSFAATTDWSMEDKRDRSSALTCPRALRRPVAVSLLIHAALFSTLLSWWHMDGASAPKGLPDGLSVTMIDLGESPAAPAPALPMVADAPTPQELSEPEPITPPAPVIPPVQRMSEVSLPEKTVKPEAKPEKKQQMAKLAAAPKPLEHQETDTPATGASINAESGESAGQLAPKGFENTAGSETDEILVTNLRYREPPHPPVYPKRARSLEQQGEAIIRVKIDTRGNPAEIFLSTSSGYALLDEAALRAVQKWRFEPERRGGRPVMAWAQIPVRFVLR